MTERTFFHALLIGWTAIAVATFVFLFRFAAPYGRHARGGFGPTIHRTTGWILMESPSAIGFLVLIAIAPRPPTITLWIFFCLWELHYANRAFVFPLRMRGGQQRMPIVIASSAFFFNCVNVYLNGRWLTALGPDYSIDWLCGIRFWIGFAMFLFGFYINLQSDSILRSLRRSSSDYQIPKGGLYRFISCPNYFGELVEWTGWAVLTWSAASASFAIWTAANLVPRAVAHHRWYREKFAEYPAQRKAVIPGLL